MAGKSETYQLSDPNHKLRSASAGRGDVRVVGSDRFTRALPAKEDLASRERQRDAAVLADGRAAIGAGNGRVEAAIAGWHDRRVGRVGAGGGLSVAGIVGVDPGRIRLVQDRQSGEVLPRKPGLIGRALADVRRKQSPSPALRDSRLEPDGHGEETIKLAEDHLLTRFGGDGLQKELRGFARVEVVEEAVHARLAEASELLAEVDVLADGSVRIVVGTLHRCLSAQDVAQQGGVADFLVGHELDQESIVGGEACSLKVFDREASESIVEEVQLDPLLVEGDGLADLLEA